MITPIRLQTDHLELVSGNGKLLHAEIANRKQLGELLAVQVPINWPPELFTIEIAEFVAAQLDKEASRGEWFHWYWILHGQTPTDRVLIGVSGFSQPTPEGTVEIAYSLLPEFQGRGYATEAVKRLVAWAFSHPEIRRVVAEALPEKIPSIHVLTRNGFKTMGEGVTKGIIVLWFELTREMYEAATHLD